MQMGGVATRGLTLGRTVKAAGGLPEEMLPVADAVLVADQNLVRDAQLAVTLRHPVVLGRPLSLVS